MTTVIDYKINSVQCFFLIEQITLNKKSKIVNRCFSLPFLFGDLSFLWVDVGIDSSNSCSETSYSKHYTTLKSVNVPECGGANAN